MGAMTTGEQTSCGNEVESLLSCVPTDTRVYCETCTNADVQLVACSDIESLESHFATLNNNVCLGMCDGADDGSCGSQFLALMKCGAELIESCLESAASDLAASGVRGSLG